MDEVLPGFRNETPEVIPDPPVLIYKNFKLKKISTFVKGILYLCLGSATTVEGASDFLE